MALHADYTGIEDYKNLCYQDDPNEPGQIRLNPVTQAIVFATMSAGIGTITEKNYIEFYLRVAASDAISPWPDRGFPIELDAVKRHIGLRTNVSLQTRAQWIKNHMDAAIQEIEYRQRRDAKQKEDA